MQSYDDVIIGFSVANVIVVHFFLLYLLFTLFLQISEFSLYYMYGKLPTRTQYSIHLNASTNDLKDGEENCFPGSLYFGVISDVSTSVPFQFTVNTEGRGSSVCILQKG